MNVFIVYLIGLVLTFIITVFLNVKYKWELDQQAAVGISILWPIVVVAGSIIFTFIKITDYAWITLNRVFKNLSNSAPK